MKIVLMMEEGFGLSSNDSNTLILDLSLLIKVNFSIKKRALASPQLKKRDNPHHPALFKILALHMVFVSNKNYLLMGLFVLI